MKRIYINIILIIYILDTGKGEMTFTAETLGSIQTLTFSERIDFTSTDPKCEDLTDADADKFGTDAECTIRENTKLRIEYGWGSNRSGGDISIALKSSAFTTNSLSTVTGTFNRALPYFELDDTDLVSTYKDYKGTVNLINRNEQGANDMYYEWRYGNDKSGPTIDHQVTNTIKYWNLDKDTAYQIKVTMKDLNNNKFGFTQISREFDVLKTCTIQCDTVQWKLHNDPGACTQYCAKNYSNTDDTMEYSISHPSYYLFKAIYQPGSKGGRILSLNSSNMNTLHSGQSGQLVIFPYDLRIIKDASTTQSSGIALPLKINFNTHSLTGDKYIMEWVNPSGASGICANGSKTCEISIGELSCGESYTFEFVLRMVCLADVRWVNVTFTSFTYEGIGESSLDTSGAIQIISFGQTVETEVTGEDCSEFLESTAHLGTNPSCSLATNQLTINYGHSLTIDTSPVLTIKPNSITPCVAVSFNRPPMPTFTLNEQNVREAYEDNIATITAIPIYTGTATMIWEWTYITSPPSGPKPNLASAGNSMVFTYREMGEGSYKVRIRMRQESPLNSMFYYEVESSGFRVVRSCSTACRTVSWRLSSNPGSCSTECVTGMGSEDNLEYSTSGSVGEYIIRATYLAGSRGGKNLTISPSKYNNLMSSSCGENIKFPYDLTIINNSVPYQSSWDEIILKTTYQDNGLSYTSDYQRTWTQPTNICTTDKECTIIQGGLLCGGPYTFGIQIILQCYPDTIWTNITFVPFIYVGVRAFSSLQGSIQTITFNEAVSYAGAGTPSCGDLLSSTVHLGDSPNYACSYSPPDLVIKYGNGTTPGAHIISVKAEAFTPCVEATFPRPHLPKFDLNSTMLNAYQDYYGTIKVENASTNGINMDYDWQYIQPIGNTSPDISGNITQMDFNYLELSPEIEYKIRIHMRDPNNGGFVFYEETSLFKAMRSCSGSCDRVTWSLSRAPIACSTDCVEGVGGEDLMVYKERGSPPYKIEAIFEGGSWGGVDLSINPDKYNSQRSGSCGSHLKFPKISMGRDALRCKSSHSPMSIGGNVRTNGLPISMGYNLVWIEPSGVTACVEGEASCTITGEGLPTGGPYTFKLYLMLLCNSPTLPWMQITFTPFIYYLQPDPVLVSNLGSLQTITFPTPVTPTSANTCLYLLTAASIPHLGLGGYSCLLGGDSLLIKYGYGTSPGTQLIHLKPLSINPCYEGSWDRPILPSFTLTVENGSDPSYTDNIAQLTVQNIIGGGIFTYEWSYATSPSGSTKPTLGSPGTSYSFQYRLMSVGSYTVNVRMKDTGNSDWYYEESTTLTVRPNSCVGSCDTITWTFTHNPGSDCNAECTNGYTAEDTIIYTYLTNPYRLNAAYQAGSIGGNDLEVIPNENNQLATIQCGSNVKFPSIVKNEDGLDMLASKHTQTLSVTLNDNGLILGTDFTQIWVINGEDSLTLVSTSVCNIGQFSMPVDVIYTYKVQLKMTCQGASAVVWDEVIFTPFEYYDIGIISGSIESMEREIEKNSTYKFSLSPSYSLPQTAAIEISLPNELVIDSSTCTSSSGSCEVINTSPGTKIRIRSLLNADYTDLSSAIIFEVNYILNPSIPYLFGDVILEVKTKRADLAIIYHESNITLTNAGRYTPHQLKETEIIVESEMAVTKTSYKFYFVNQLYTVPIASKILVQFPSTLQVLEGSPTLYDTRKIHTNYVAFMTGNNLTISNWRTTILNPNNNRIKFKVKNVLNPYALGPTDPFRIFIYVNDDPLYKIFEMVETRTISINLNASFTSFSVTPSTGRTSDQTHYTFLVGVGDRDMKLGHIIKFQSPPEVQICDIFTLDDSLDPNVEIGAKSFISPNNYSFVLAGDVARLTSFTFRIECRNPYTTRPPNNEFKIWGILSSPYNEFYSKSSIIPTMTAASSFRSLSVSLSEVNPQRLNTFTFTVETTSPFDTTLIDTLLITIPDGMQIKECQIVKGSGLFGFLSCAVSEQEITISGIIKLENNFIFELHQIRNPSESTEPMSFGLESIHSDGYIGEVSESVIQYIECNFPCFTCSSASDPDLCTSCFPYRDEVFDYTGISLHMHYVDHSQCLTRCITHTYNDTLASCRDCNPLCNECQDTATYCTKCYPNVNLFLHENSCIFPCPYGYGPDENLWICANCSLGCATCDNETSTGCTTCIDDYYWLRTFQCIDHCPYQQFYNETEYICSPCSNACSKCSELTDMDCIECNRDAYYYPFFNDPSHCILFCNYDPPHYLDGSVCRPCHANSLICYGEEIDECFKCRPPYYLGNKEECVYENCDNYPNTFPSNYVCEDCHPSCNGCKEFPNYCLACVSGNFLNPQSHSCAASCPPNYYTYLSLQKCQACPLHCITCERINFQFPEDISLINFICLTCNPDYYLSSEDLCVSGDKCGIKYYADRATMTCQLCSQECLGCVGPENTQCLNCQQEYVFTSTGLCSLKKCTDNEYIDAHSLCQACHGRCNGCIGATEENCLACNEALFPVSKIAHQVSCIPCEEKKGYFTLKNVITGKKECVEICGDGIDLGEYECDDGNKNNGDGCDKECRIEEGYSCNGGNPSTADICRDIMPPQIDIAPKESKTLLKYYFQLSKPVQSLTIEEPKTFVQLSIKGGYNQYLFDHEVQFHNYLSNTNNHQRRQVLIEEEEIELFSTIVVQFIPLSSNMNNDVLTIVFNAGKLADSNTNILHAASFSIPLFEFKYVDPRDEEVVKSSGNTVLYSMIGLLSFNVLVAVVCSSGMSFLFPLFNMIQLINLMPLLELNLPENLRTFIGKYLQFANLKFDFMYNPFHTWNMINLSEVNNRPLNDNFESNGLMSKAFLVNYGGQLIIWTVIIALYIPITGIAKCCKWQIFINLKRAYEYGVLLTSFSEAFLEFSLLSFLNIYQIEFGSKAKFLTSSIGIMGILLSSGYIVLVLNLISRMGKGLKKEENQQKFGAIYADTNYKKHKERRNMKQYYIIVFLGRRLGYVLIILFLWRMPIVQQCFNIFLHTLTFIYDVLMRPHGITLLGIMIYFYDFILLLFFATLPLYMKFVDNAEFIGRIHIYSLIATLILSWIIIIIVNIRIIYLKFRKPKQSEIIEQIVSQINDESRKDNSSIFTRVRLQMNKDKPKTPNKKGKILVRTNIIQHKPREKGPRIRIKVHA